MSALILPNSSSTFVFQTSWIRTSSIRFTALLRVQNLTFRITGIRFSLVFWVAEISSF